MDLLRQRRFFTFGDHEWLGAEPHRLEGRCGTESDEPKLVTVKVMLDHAVLVNHPPKQPVVRHR